jgi:hypothetical protein
MSVMWRSWRARCDNGARNDGPPRCLSIERSAPGSVRPWMTRRAGPEGPQVRVNGVDDWSTICVAVPVSDPCDRPEQ